MASAPTTTGNAPTYRPLFKRVGQNELKDAHRSDFLSELAAVATIAGVSLEEVYACAIKSGLLAAQACFDALVEGRRGDELTRYPEAFALVSLMAIDGRHERDAQRPLEDGAEVVFMSRFSGG